MSQLEPDNPIYNVAGAVQFDGLLNIQALQHSLDEVVRRHEILRSLFVAEGQQVLPDSRLPLAYLDFTGFSHERAMDLFPQCADDFIHRPFLLTGQPPLRALLAVLSEQRHILLLALHHIVSDRWSVGVLMQEVAALYAAYGHGKPSSLTELPIQYGDFCVWQRRQREKWARHLDYWRQKLAGAPPLLELPTDRPRPPVLSYRGGMYSFEFSAELSRTLKELGKQYNATLFMVVAAALNTLLYRYTGSQDICIGYPVAGRGQSQTAALIGFFVNTLVLRCQIEADLPFSELLLQLREQALQDQNHQELSFGQLLDTLKPVRNTGHAPLFQVMLAVQNVPATHFRMQDVSAMPLAMNTHIAQFDLSLFVDERDGQLFCSFEYSTALFDAGTVARMAGHLQTILAGAASNPDLPVGRLPLLTPTESRQLLDDWSGRNNQASYADGLMIHQCIEAQARMAPDRSALVFAGQSLSYGELDRRAQQWAERLSASGVGPECRVGVCAERSLELIVGLLAVLKAGSAYVPLDPSYPKERLDAILDDAGIGVMLTQSSLADGFQRCSIKVYCLDREPALYPAATVLACPAAQENTAYIIYTSGSTGRPKGVAISHRNLLHSTLARANYYREMPECFLLLSSFAFDSSVAGIFWTLSQGGCLCLPKQDELTDTAALTGLINRHRVTHLLALPSFYAAIADDRYLDRLRTLQSVIVAGEACSGEIAAGHHRKLPKVRFYNEYGPTEGTVWSSVYRSDENAGDMTLPVGRPVDSVSIYILDRQLQPVPAGVGGELCVGGAGVARGYLNRPALTAEKFIPSPFSAEGARLYKTGDLARFGAGGEIEFLGRIDNQIKIRGYRIELGEIEERLQLHPAIQEAVVLAKEDVSGHKKLLAYLVASPSATVPENSALQAFLKQTLPDYMLPANYVVLDKLPLMPNGKRDRLALLAIAEPALPERELKPVSNWIEAELAGIWREVLGLEAVGVDADFFEQGGHSLAAIQVKSRIQSVFNIELPAKALFELRTVELQAAELARLQIQQHDDRDLEKLLAEIEQLPDDEADYLLANEI
ncbi:non-ribosomal peptide synthetase [Methylomicrobium album]|nr:amino acid adenylation domain-containing protein [Methylomicrobium album]